MKKLCIILLAIVGFVLVQPAASVATDLVNGSEIQNESVTGADIDNGTLTGLDIRNGTVTSTDVSGLTGSDFVDGSVGSPDISNGGVRSIDIADAGIMPEDISPEAIDAIGQTVGQHLDADLKGSVVGVRTDETTWRVDLTPGDYIAFLNVESSLGEPVQVKLDGTSCIAVPVEGFRVNCSAVARVDGYNVSSIGFQPLLADGSTPNLDYVDIELVVLRIG